MKKAPIALILLLSSNTIFFLLNGCCKKPQECTYFTKGSLTTLYELNHAPHLVDAAGVHATSMYLELKLVDTTYLCAAPLFSLPSNTAYATSCGSYPPIVLKIDSFSISSDHDFDAAHPAGTDLKAIFRYENDDTYKDLPRIFVLRSNPADTGTHVFTIKVFTAEPAKNFFASTGPVKLLL